MRVVCGIDWLACHVEFFVNNPLDIKENYEHALDFALLLSRLSSSKACVIIAIVSIALFPRFVQNLMHSYSYLVGSIVKLHQARYMTANKMF
jgi:hypothetical protein